MSKSGRLFVNFPRWSDRYLNAVIEVGSDGTTKPFPDEQWNRWDRKQENAGKQFVCVQSVVIDKAGMLWVLDPAAPTWDLSFRAAQNLSVLTYGTTKSAGSFRSDQNRSRLTAISMMMFVLTTILTRLTSPIAVSEEL